MPLKKQKEDKASQKTTEEQPAVQLVTPDQLTFHELAMLHNKVDKLSEKMEELIKLAKDE